MAPKLGSRTCAMAALGAMLCTQAALAQTQPAPAASPPGAATEAPAPASAIGREPLTLNTGATPADKPFGTEGTRWLEFGGLAADNFEDAVDVNLHARLSEFIAQDVELGGELAGWNCSQVGDNTQGASLVLIVRWHFINRGDWTLYLDAGVGAMVANAETPDGGTSFNLMPRAGAGLTRAIGADGARLELGVRWHHISNARITGDGDNPSRDSVALYLGFAIPMD